MLDALSLILEFTNGSQTIFYANDGEEAVEYWANHPNTSAKQSAFNFLEMLKSNGGQLELIDNS